MEAVGAYGSQEEKSQKLPIQVGMLNNINQDDPLNLGL
jgi:hypothetical protein